MKTTSLLGIFLTISMPLLCSDIQQVRIYHALRDNSGNLNYTDCCSEEQIKKTIRTFKALNRANTDCYIRYKKKDLGPFALKELTLDKVTDFIKCINNALEQEK